LFIPEPIRAILLTLHHAGFSAFIVGGAVRDYLLGKKPQDYDLATSATPQEVMRLFAHTVPTGIKHGTITVLSEGVGCEVTTYRVESGYTDHRRPGEVTFTHSIEEDLARRDFTINAIAFDGTQFVDPFGGIEDLRKGEIRAVEDPFERFREDALRMMRAVRFASQLGFKIEEKTMEAIRANASLIAHISMERIRDELCKILITEKPSYGIRLLSQLELLRWFLPELEACRNFEQKNPHHDKDVLEHILAVVDHTKSEMITRLAALFHDIGKPPTFSLDENGVGHFYKHDLVGAEMTLKIMQRLKFDRRTTQIVSTLVREHMCRFSKIKPKSIKKLINRVGRENLDYFFDLQMADMRGHAKTASIEEILKVKEEAIRIIHQQEPLSIKELDVDGNDLIELGIKPGKEIGSILNLLLERVLENPDLNRKDLLLEIAKAEYGMKERA